MENISVEYCNSDCNYIEQIKDIERNTSLSIQNFELALGFWNNTIIVPSLSQLIAKDKLRTKNLCEELEKQNSIAKVVAQDKDNIFGQATKYTQMGDLQKQETAIIKNIENIEQEIYKLKCNQIEGRNLMMHKRLEIQKNFAKISKKLTGASFEYQGPNISGFIINGYSFQVFDLNPNKLNEQDMSKCLWESLSGASLVDWFDIFNNI